MKDGRITDTGTYNDLVENNGEFSELISSYQQDNSLDESDSDRAMSSGECVYVYTCMLYHIITVTRLHVYYRLFICVVYIKC